MSDEVAALNNDFALPAALEIRIEQCGEANAWYDPSDASITVCSEYVTFLTELVGA
ncbi:DUF4344 domain-containing metallopeptidase [Roseovarius sp. 2305UL8-3]|uniref:DUF4344 domain-containing metallopeptidase n=1 Tax=Roseovarius conchicola TaxID=3121636 RepID=UPI003528C917